MGGKKTVENSRRFEKDRRDKLNVAFMELCKLLPEHDPSITLSKMEILRKAAEYIKYLQVQNDEIMKMGEDSALKNESEKLKKRVAHLLLKTKELVDALRSAGVPIPTPKRRKRKPKSTPQEVSPSNQNKISNDQEEAKTSKDEATAIKKVKCGCMKMAPEKKPLKESNPMVTASPTTVALPSISPATCSTSAIAPPWTNHTKLLTVTPTPLISASVMTTRVQNLPVVKQILPNTNNSITNPPLAGISGSTALLPKSKVTGEVKSSSKNLPVIKNGINSLPMVPSTIQTIPIIGNNLLTPNIVKEVSQSLINKTAVNIVTTTSSNSIPTQTIVNSTHLITLSQSNIISAPVVAPGIQTVPVIEKNLLSNLGPGTLILADGRIVNVPPIVPQILVKPQPTVILMPSTKKKEKVIIPKKRDVTKTTFANKAPIPAIQTFRLESCPKVRPKKKPKAPVKKSEKTKIIESGSDSEQAKKKRKLDDSSVSLISKGDENKKMDSLSEASAENTNPSGEQISKGDSACDVSIPGDLNCIVSNNENINTISSDLSKKSTETLEPSENCSLEELKTTEAKITESNSNLADHTVLFIEARTFDSLPDASVQPNSVEESTMDAHADIDLSSNIGQENNISSRTDEDQSTGVPIEQSSFDLNSEELGLATSAAGSDGTTCGTDGTSSQATNHDHESETTSTEMELNKLKNNPPSNNAVLSDPISNSDNTSYPESLKETACLPAASSNSVSLFVPSNEKCTETKTILPSCSPNSDQAVYTDMEINQDGSANDCFQQEGGLDSRIPEVETHPSSIPSGNVEENRVCTENSLLSDENQRSKLREDLANVTDVAGPKTGTSSMLSNEKLFPNQDLIHNELPDLGSNALVDNNSIFPQINEMSQSLSLSGQEKNIYSQANSFQHDDHVLNSKTTVGGMTGLIMVGSKNPLPSASVNSFSQQQSTISKQVQSQLSQPKINTSQSFDPFGMSMSTPRQDNTIYSQGSGSLMNTKPSESSSNLHTYGMSGVSIYDKSTNYNYNTNVPKSVSFSSVEKSPRNSLPLMTSVNQISRSNPSTYSGYCSVNLYPTNTVTYSQNSFMMKPTNKLSNSVPEVSKKTVPCGGFNDPNSLMNIGEKQFYNHNMSFNSNSLPKPNWEKTNSDKAYYNSLNSNLQDNNSAKDKSTFQYGKVIEKQNESHIPGQLMYLGFQKEPVTPYSTSGFFQNFPPTSGVLQTSCGFHDIPSSIGNHSSIISSKTMGHGNPLIGNSSLVERNPQEKQCNNSQNIVDKGSSSQNMDKDNARNSSFFPVSQPSEAMGYASSHSENLHPSQSNSYETNSNLNANKPSEGNCLPHKYPSEQKKSCVETHKANNNNSAVQINTSHSVYNPSIANSAFVEGNGKATNQNSKASLDERRKAVEVPNSYSQEKEISKTSRFTETSKLVSCNPSESEKVNPSYSVNMVEKENITQNSSSISVSSSKNISGGKDERNATETGGYTYAPKSSATNIQNNSSEMNNMSHKIIDSIGNAQTHYKDYVGIQSNGEKQMQEHHKLLPSSTVRKSVSTDMNTDDFQTFNFNATANYQKLLQPQNTAFTSNSSRVPGTASYINFDNVPFDAINNHYSTDNGTAVSTSNSGVCSTQSMNRPLQLLPPPTSGSDQVTPHSSNKTDTVSVISNSMPQKESNLTKICPPASDGSSFKGDMNIDFMKSKDVDRNTFIPIIDDVRLTSDLSSDLFSSLQLPTGGQHSESISPTAAFLLAFPLVSTSRNIENLPDNENNENQTSTPTTILQIGNIEPPNTEMFHPIEFQKNNKGNDHYEMNSDYIHVNEIHNKQNSSYNKTCEKRKDVFPDFNKEQRTEPKAKSKSSTATTNTYSGQSYNYNSFPNNDYQQYCNKEGPLWQQEFPSNVSKEQKKVCERKKDKGVQKGCFYQNYQEYYSYKDKKRKQQNRVPVNWMTTPENRDLPEYQPKDPQITNSYASGHSSQPGCSTIPIDFPTEYFPDFCNSKKTNNYSWSPSKTLLPALDNHLMIPSTLPTLVGDLALGTSTPSESYKTFELPKAQPPQAQNISNKKPSEKMDENKKQTEFSKSQANFFSVSQLVDPKSKKQKTSERNYKRQDKASKPRGNFTCSKRKDDHCMFYEESNNFVTNQNQCTEKRHVYKGGSYSAESLIGSQPAEVDFSSNLNYQQNSNYFQNDFTTHVDSGQQQYGYFQQTHFSGFPHDEYQDFGFGTNQRTLDQNRQKISGCKDDNYQGAGILQPQIYPSYSKSIHYNLPTSLLNTNTTTTLTNFHLSAIFPEINDQRVGTSAQTTQQMNSSFPSSQNYRSHLQQ